jgi:predicted dehydrogenase
MTNKQVRVGVVGLGKMGLLHTSILNILPNTQLAGVCEKSSLVRKIAKKVFRNVAITQDVTEFASLNLDAVYITTPIPSHYAVAKAVYDGKIASHIFMEKPLTASYLQSQELCQLAQLHGGNTMVGYLRRFYVTFTKAKELLDGGSLGIPLSFTVKALSSDFSGVKNNPTASIARGGVLRDLGSYALDLSLWFFKDLKVETSKIEGKTGTGAEDNVTFTLEGTSQPLHGDLEVSWCKEGYRMPEVIFSINGTRGTVEVNDDKVTLTPKDGAKQTWFRHDLHDQVGFWLGNPEYYREDTNFIESILADTPCEPTFKTASRVDHLIDEIQKKAEPQ